MCDRVARLVAPVDHTTPRPLRVRSRAVARVSSRTAHLGARDPRRVVRVRRGGAPRVVRRVRARVRVDAARGVRRRRLDRAERRARAVLPLLLRGPMSARRRGRGGGVPCAVYRIAQPCARRKRRDVPCGEEAVVSEPHHPSESRRAPCRARGPHHAPSHSSEISSSRVARDMSTLDRSSRLAAPVVVVERAVPCEWGRAVVPRDARNVTRSILRRAL